MHSIQLRSYHTRPHGSLPTYHFYHKLAHTATWFPYSCLSINAWYLLDTRSDVSINRCGSSIEVNISWSLQDWELLLIGRLPTSPSKKHVDFPFIKRISSHNLFVIYVLVLQGRKMYLMWQLSKQKRRNERKKKVMPTARGVPRRSPIQVLTTPNVA